MKKLVKVLAMLMALGFCFVSCSHDAGSDGGNGGNGGGSGSYATFAGTSWTYMESTLVFNNNGTGTLTHGSPLKAYSFTYTVQGNVATITIDGEQGTFTLANANATTGIFDTPDPIWNHMKYTKVGGSNGNGGNEITFRVEGKDERKPINGAIVAQYVGRYCVHNYPELDHDFLVTFYIDKDSCEKMWQKDYSYRVYGNPNGKFYAKTEYDWNYTGDPTSDGTVELDDRDLKFIIKSGVGSIDDPHSSFFDLDFNYSDCGNVFKRIK